MPQMQNICAYLISYHLQIFNLAEEWGDILRSKSELGTLDQKHVCILPKLQIKII